MTSTSLRRFLSHAGTGVPVIALITAFGLLAQPAAAQVYFAGGLRLDLTVGATPQAVAMVDLNGDGALDLVTANFSAATVSVLLGDGDGRYGARVDHVTGAGPFSVAVGDVSGDGVPDIITPNYSAASLSLLVGDGNGGFAPKRDFATGNNPCAVALGDVTGDHRRDVVVANYGSTSISVFPGNGLGGLGTRTNHTTGVQPRGVALADLNGDGLLDIVTVNRLPSTVSVLLANGAGGYAAKVDYATGLNPLHVAAADVGGDGHIDIVTTNNTANTISVFPGTGTGTLGTRVDHVTGTGPYATVIADLNGDNLVDLAAANNTGASVSVLLGTGAGAFGAKSDLATAAGAMGIAAGDANGDGRLDLATPSQASASVTLLLGNNVGLLGARVNVPLGYIPQVMAADDLDGDGFLDVVVGYSNAADVQVLFGDGQGGFTPGALIPVAADVFGLVIGDIDRDGAPDVAVACGVGVSVLKGDGAGNLGSRIDYAMGLQPKAIDLGDLNHDGWLDMVIADSSAGSVGFRLGDGTGGFSGYGDLAIGINLVAVALGDITGDGHLDIVATDFAADTVTLLPGLGTGLFAGATSYATGAFPRNLELGDLDGDGRLDVLVANALPGVNTVSVLLNDGVGGLAPRTDYAAPVGCFDVAVGDLNQDGRLDAAACGTTYSHAMVLLGDGLGHLGGGEVKAAGTMPSSVLLVDLDRDGRSDLVTANYSASSVSVWRALHRTRTALSVTPEPAIVGAPVTLTAEVQADGGLQPAGTVTFLDGATPLGTSPVVGGRAALAYYAPRPGARPLTAVYNGDGSCLRSRSAVREHLVVTGAAPAISSIRDIRADQGGQVRLKFAGSGFDHAGSPTPIANYLVYRKSSGTAAAAGPDGLKLAGWDYVAAVPATTDGPYETVVPTLADSNAAGIHRAVFMVRATTYTPGTMYDAAPDSGYSVDNLAPLPPTGLAGAWAGGATTLTWAANLDADLWHYRLYRGASASFVPDASSLVANVAATSHEDPAAPGGWYKLAAVDRNGNESGFAVLAPAATSDVPGAVALRLHANTPNPFNPRTTIAFDLPRAMSARVAVYDVRGRLVRLVAEGERPAGTHQVQWDGLDDRGAAVPSGTYFARLETTGQAQAVSMSLVR